MPTPVSEIRKRIQKQRGIDFKPKTKKVVTIEQQPTPFPKSNLMRLLELRHRKSIEELLYQGGTIYEVAKKLDIDATTVSKWRKLMSEASDKEFWNKMKEEQ